MHRVVGAADFDVMVLMHFARRSSTRRTRSGALAALAPPAAPRLRRRCAGCPRASGRVSVLIVGDDLGDRAVELRQAEELRGRAEPPSTASLGHEHSIFDGGLVAGLSSPAPEVLRASNARAKSAVRAIELGVVAQRLLHRRRAVVRHQGARRRVERFQRPHMGTEPVGARSACAWPRRTTRAL